MRCPGMGPGLAQLHEPLLTELDAAGAELAQGGDRQLAPARVQRQPEPGRAHSIARPGWKYPVTTEAHRCPLAVSLTGGNSNDVTQLIPIQAIPPVPGRCGRHPGAWRRSTPPTRTTMTNTIICRRRLTNLSLC